ncbi:Chromosome segregation ATPase, partial [Giardia duodenalis]
VGGARFYGFSIQLYKQEILRSHITDDLHDPRDMGVE